MDAPRSTRRTLRVAWLIAALVLYLVAASYQLGLPGLHYDEAREAGQNAMELLTGAPVRAFRGATVHLLGRDLPLMVQDYIGALNVYLALPLLWLTGIGVPNLRALGVLTGLLALIFQERAVSEWLWLGSPQREARGGAPLSVGGLVALTLAALSPSFVFWSRQGVFVTNLTQPLTLACIALGLRWWRTGSRWALWASALAAGLALYAKLLAVWLLLPFAICMAVVWLARGRERRPVLGWGTFAVAALAFLLPLVPLGLFNLRTGGTLAALTGSLTRSYYGVDNRAVLANMGVRLPQLGQILQGGQFWYLGGPITNALAPWLAAGLLLAGALAAWRRVLPPPALLAAAVLMSLVTVSDLFITHYALLLPVLLGCVGVAVGALLEWSRGRARLRTPVRAALAVAVALWVVLDVAAVAGYHRALAQTGGLGDHSDASYALAYHLLTHGMGSPIALDWGMDATVRYLSEGAVTPIEIFGYGSPQTPDDQFAARLGPFLDNPDNVYLLRAPGNEVFAGRRAVFEEVAAEKGLRLERLAVFAQRDGAPLYEVWKAGE